jgi:hypothetical protein
MLNNIEYYKNTFNWYSSEGDRPGIQPGACSVTVLSCSGALLSRSYTGSSKKNAGIIKTYHSKTVKHIEMIQVLKCGKRT